MISLHNQSKIGKAGVLLNSGLKKWRPTCYKQKEIIFFLPLLHSASRIKTERGTTKQKIRECFSVYNSALLALPGENFDNFVHRRRMFKKIQQVTQHGQETFTCNCKTYLHSATCKHSLGMCILHNLVTVPPQWKCNSLEQLKKRGRPKSVKNCLQKQK